MEPSRATPDLDPNSHTFHRLQHATPEHLYITTRRCFIGPIPEGWLKSHRKSWYQQHLHINYSSNAATFSAPPNISHQRRVTGLDDGANGIHKQSFPQPEGTRDEAGQGNETQTTTTTAPPASAAPRVSDPDKKIPQKERPRFDHVETTGESQTLKDGASSNGNTHSPKPSLKQPKGESKKAHRTSNHKSKRDRQVSTVVEEDGESIPDTDVVDSPDLKRISLVESQTGILSSVDSRGSELLGANASTSSLIHRDTETLGEEDSEQRPQSGPRSLLAKVKDATSKSSAQVDGTTDTADPPRRRSSHIHFNIPEDSTRANLLLKARLTQLDLKTPLRVLKRRSTMDGQIIKMEKMLVRVDQTLEQNLPSDYDEKSSQGVVTSTLEKWREFMVVCRKTSKNEDAEFVLQVYKTRVRENCFLFTIALIFSVTDISTRSFQQLKTQKPRKMQLARSHCRRSLHE
jgi:hypothetical protein